MLIFEKFSGINNVLPSHRLKPEQLTEAVNVDAGLDGELRRRAGYTQLSNTCHKNIWQGAGFLLATRAGNDLVARTPNGTETVVQAAMGTARVWYCNLPDGRTIFTNGAISGVTNGSVTTAWGVPIPSSLGALTAVAGSLYPGDYQYQLTHVRLADNLEGPPLYSDPVAVPSGGIVLSGLPVLAGHKLNVYITGANGQEARLAGSTTNSMFSYTGTNTALSLPCHTEFLHAPPAGTVLGLWRGRVLMAEGGILHASRNGQWELFDMRRDFKRFSAPITLIQPVDEGVFVGTQQELCYLAGTEFDKLVYTKVVDGPVALGSGVPVRGELIKRGDNVGEGSAMVCIADGVVTAGFSDGAVARLSEGRYRANVTEVAATFRMNNGVPQYLAIPQ